MKDRQSLSRWQYDEIMNDIWQYHRFGGLSHMSNPYRGIKYIHPTWDMRDGRCFHIMFRGNSTPTDGLNFDFRDSEVPMFQRIMEWLNGIESTEQA